MEEREKHSARKDKTSASFKVGAIALAFLIIGYQAALFIHSAAVTGIAAHRDAPDTVFVLDEALARELLAEEASRRSQTDEGSERLLSDDVDGSISGGGGASSGAVIIRRQAERAEDVEAVRQKVLPRRVESFPFDPNTVSVSDLQRLGFSEKQALSIDSYRRKGGHFRRASDFAKSYVVADSVFKRLAPFIRIPKVDINAADSAAFDALPGIGPYFAAKMVSYRSQLGGYSYPEQLMDIYNFDEEKYDGLKDLITVGPHEPYPLWSLPEEDLKKHPYIGSYSAHGVVVYRDNNPSDRLTVEGLAAAGILKPDLAEKMLRCDVK